MQTEVYCFERKILLDVIKILVIQTRKLEFLFIMFKSISMLSQIRVFFHKIKEKFIRNNLIGRGRELRKRELSKQSV